MLLGISLALTAGLSAPDLPGAPLNTEPTIPIPTGQVHQGGLFLSFESSSVGGTRLGVGWRTEDGVEFRAHSAGPVEEWAVQTVHQGEYTQTSLLTRTGPGIGPGVVTRSDRFLSDSVLLRSEVPKGREGTAVRAELQLFPLEGVMFTAGFDTRTLDVFTGIQLGF